jgi:hypothetical protein
MARKVQAILIDDLDGSQANETVRFSVDGRDYEIDLNTGHAEELRSALAEYSKLGRKRRRRGPSAGGGSHLQSNPGLSEITWHEPLCLEPFDAAAARQLAKPPADPSPKSWDDPSHRPCRSKTWTSWHAAGKL